MDLVGGDDLDAFGELGGDVGFVESGSHPGESGDVEAIPSFEGVGEVGRHGEHRPLGRRLLGDVRDEDAVFCFFTGSILKNEESSVVRTKGDLREVFHKEWVSPVRDTHEGVCGHNDTEVETLRPLERGTERIPRRVSSGGTTVESSQHLSLLGRTRRCRLEGFQSAEVTSSGSSEVTEQYRRFTFILGPLGLALSLGTSTSFSDE